MLNLCIKMENNPNNDVMDMLRSKKLVKVCAPMVRYSKFQFRSLVREYCCDLCFTPMILADSFCQSQKARENEFITNKVGKPLIIQFAANTVHDFIGAAHIASPYCDGVDLNCGCPQRWAKAQGIGCIMLEDPEKIYDIVRQCRNHITKPFTVSVKMRILSDIKKTISICQQLEHCGVSFLTVHGRTPSQKTDDVNIEALRLVSDCVTCPVIANGGVKNLDDVYKLQEATNCKGVMVANGLLTNPALFSGHPETPLSCVQKWLDICFNSIFHPESYSNFQFASEKLKTLTFQCFHHHLVFMLEKILPKKDRKIFNNLQSFSSVLEYLEENLKIKPCVLDFRFHEMYKPIVTDFENRLDKYMELCDVFNAEVKRNNAYDYSAKSGKYFDSFVSNDTCISDLFVDS